jgi:hypothetical protein
VALEKDAGSSPVGHPHKFLQTPWIVPNLESSFDRLYTSSTPTRFLNQSSKSVQVQKGFYNTQHCEHIWAGVSLNR